MQSSGYMNRERLRVFTLRQCVARSAAPRPTPPNPIDEAEFPIETAPRFVRLSVPNVGTAQPESVDACCARRNDNRIIVPGTTPDRIISRVLRSVINCLDPIFRTVVARVATGNEECVSGGIHIVGDDRESVRAVIPLAVDASGLV